MTEYDFKFYIWKNYKYVYEHINMLTYKIHLSDEFSISVNLLEHLGTLVPSIMIKDGSTFKYYSSFKRALGYIKQNYKGSENNE